MKCPACGTGQSTVFKTLDDERAISRQRRCACGARWYTDERVRKGSLMVISQPLVTSNGGSLQVSSLDQDPISSLRRSESESDAQVRVEPTVFDGMLLSKTGETWGVPVSYDVSLSASFPAMDRQAQYAKAATWLVANPAKRKTPRGMPTFLFNWFSRAQNSGQAAGPAWQPKPAPLPFALAAEEGRQQRASDSRIAELTERLHPPKPPMTAQQIRAEWGPHAAAKGTP